MVKFNYGTVNLWIDQKNGSLNIQSGRRTTVIPHEDGKELIRMLKVKTVHFEEVKANESSGFFAKIKRFFYVKQTENDW